MSKKIRQIHIIAVLFIFLFLSTTNAFAKIELSYSTPPAEIKPDETFSLNITLSGVDENAEYYIRGVFYKPESTQYFGFTQNNLGSWQSDPNDYTQLYKVTGNSTNPITFKVDTSSPYFVTNSNYFFKIGRYTPGGSLSWSDQSPSIVLIKSVEPTPTPSPTVTPSLTVTPTPQPIPVNQDSIQLSEIVACPNDDQGEWIELFNKTDKTITIQSWKIKDSSDTRSIDVNNTISPYNYLVIRLSSSILNNSGDTVRLFSDQNTLVDQMSYSSCPAGTSYISVNGSWQPTQQTTQGLANVLISLVTATPSPVITSSISIDEVLISSNSAQELLNTDEVSEYSFNPDVQIASISAISSSGDGLTVESSSEANLAETAAAKAQNKSLLTSSTAFLLAGCSYVLSAAMFAQKWYNLTSYVLTTVSTST